MNPIVNAIIAEKIVGMKPWPGMPGMFKQVYVAPGDTARPFPPPDYTGDLPLAWTVAHKFSDEFRKIQFVRHSGGVILFRKCKNTNNPQEELARGETDAHVICLAALKIAGIEI